MDGVLEPYWDQGWEGRIEFAFIEDGSNQPVFLQDGDLLTIYSPDDLILWSGQIQFVPCRFWDKHKLPAQIWSRVKQKGVSYAQWMDWFWRKPPLRAKLQAGQPRPTSPWRRLLPLILLLLLPLLAAWLVLYATRWGPWIESDSIEYIEAARNLAAGKGPVLLRASGEVVPMQLRPPFYSIALAGLLLTGMDAVQAGRIIAVLTFSGILLLTALLGLVVKDRLILPLLLGAYLLTSPPLVIAAARLMSETLFLLLVFLAIGLAAAAISGRRSGLLLLAAAISGLAALTRFAGIACVAVIALVPLLDPSRPPRRKLGHVLLFLLIGLLPFVLWTLSLRLGGYTPGEYALPQGNLWNALQPVRLEFTRLFWEWLPLRFLILARGYRPRLILLLAFFLILSCLIGWLALRPKKQARRSDPPRFVPFLGLLLLLFAAFHALLVAASYILVSLPKPALDERVLLPSQLALIAGLVLALYGFLSPHPSPLGRLAFPLLLLIPLILAGWSTVRQDLRTLHDQGKGYTARHWHTAPILDALRALPPSLAIASNDPDAVTFFAERPAFFIPELETASPLPPSAWAPFGQTLQPEAETFLVQCRLVLVLFSQGRHRFSHLYGEQAPQRLEILLQGLQPLYQGPDGGIYLPPCP